MTPDNDDFLPSAPHRYVPTLTERVPDAQPSAARPAPAPAGTPAAGAAVTAEQVLALLAPDLDQRISEAIAQALHEQMLGLGARVRTPAGPFGIDLAYGQRDRKLRLRGKGLGAGDKRGDLLAKIMIRVPAQITDEERDLWSKLAEISTFKARS